MDQKQLGWELKIVKVYNIQTCLVPSFLMVLVLVRNPVPCTMMGSTVSVVEESNDKDYPKVKSNECAPTTAGPGGIDRNRPSGKTGNGRQEKPDSIINLTSDVVVFTLISDGRGVG